MRSVNITYFHDPRTGLPLSSAEVNKAVSGAEKITVLSLHGTVASVLLKPESRVLALRCHNHNVIFYSSAICGTKLLEALMYFRDERELLLVLEEARSRGLLDDYERGFLMKPAARGDSEIELWKYSELRLWNPKPAPASPVANEAVRAAAAA